MNRSVMFLISVVFGTVGRSYCTSNLKVNKQTETNRAELNSTFLNQTELNLIKPRLLVEPYFECHVVAEPNRIQLNQTEPKHSIDQSKPILSNVTSVYRGPYFLWWLD